MPSAALEVQPPIQLLQPQPNIAPRIFQTPLPSTALEVQPSQHTVDAAQSTAIETSLGTFSSEATPNAENINTPCSDSSVLDLNNSNLDDNVNLDNNGNLDEDGEAPTSPNDCPHGWEDVLPDYLMAHFKLFKSD